MFAATYDAWNRLVKLEDAATSDVVQENEYDARRFRTVRKDYDAGTLDETRHFYYTESWQSIEERIDLSNQPDSQYLWGLRYIDDLVCRDRDADGVGILEERLYVLQQSNWNVSAITDENGSILERFIYDPYGRPLTVLPSFGSRTSSAFDWQFLSTCRRLDSGTSLTYLRTRFCHTHLGQFLHRDPLGYADGFNLSQYVRSNPLAFIDPLGLQTESSRALKGIGPDKKCKDVCGPDVTEWFIKDLRDHTDRLAAAQKTKNPFNYAIYWKKHAKYYLSYKWMDFPGKGCGTGKCKNTVMFSSVCMRKNQLGNIAFGFIVRMIPPYPLMENRLRALGPDHPIRTGYEAGDSYGRNHPHSGNYGNFSGVRRADNLAAFSLGYYLGAPPVVDPMIFRANKEQREVLMSLLLSEKSTYGKYSHLHGQGSKGIGQQTLTFTPEFGGFNTQSCQRCKSDGGKPIAYNGKTSSRDAFQDLEARYEGKRPDVGFDQWLKQTYEDYAASYPE